MNGHESTQGVASPNGAQDDGAATGQAGSNIVATHALARRAQVNRANALRSTGPRTPAGKARSRRNSRTHGLTCKKLLLDGEDQEDIKGFRRLLRRFREDLAPANAIEEVLVERLVISYWRLGRVVLAEKGAVERQFDALELGRDERTCERAEELLVGDVENPVDRLRDLPGVDSLLDALAHARQQVEERGYLMPDELEVFGTLFGYTSAVLGQAAKMRGTDAEERRAQALAFLGGIEEDLQNRRARLLEHAQRELEHERMRLAVPDEATANRLVRYEAHLDRTFFRTLHELERLQAMRRGELVPPRIHVDVDVAGRRD